MTTNVSHCLCFEKKFYLYERLNKILEVILHVCLCLDLPISYLMYKAMFEKARILQGFWFLLNIEILKYLTLEYFNVSLSSGN